MIPIDSHRVTPQILSLFDLSKPMMPRAFNVLEGLNRGQILVDDLTTPTWAVVREAIYGTLYIGGQFDAPLLASLIGHFRNIGDLGIGCWLDDPLNDLLLSRPDYDGRTLYFTERSLSSQKQPVQIPNGYILAARDRRYLTESFDYENTLQAFGTEENILQHTLGVVVLHEGRIVCEAATGAPTHGRIEVGVTTAEAHRRRGLAEAACARLIQMCEAEGYATWWDCAKQNIPSIRLAQKLGYINEREYRFMWWSGNKA